MDKNSEIKKKKTLTVCVTVHINLTMMTFLAVKLRADYDPSLAQMFFSTQVTCICSLGYNEQCIALGTAIKCAGIYQYNC